MIGLLGFGVVWIILVGLFGFVFGVFFDLVDLDFVFDFVLNIIVKKKKIKKLIFYNY